MNDLTGALCVGQHELFDSPFPDDLEEAATICARCPVIAACEARFIQAVTAPNILPGRYGPRGMWAGKPRGPVDARAKNNPRLAVEDEMFTLDTAREARMAYMAGDRSEWAEVGKRAYFRLIKRAARPSKVA